MCRVIAANISHCAAQKVGKVIPNVVYKEIYHSHLTTSVVSICVLFSQTGATATILLDISEKNIFGRVCTFSRPGVDNAFSLTKLENKVKF